MPISPATTNLQQIVSSSSCLSHGSPFHRQLAGVLPPSSSIKARVRLLPCNRVPCSSSRGNCHHLLQNHSDAAPPFSLHHLLRSRRKQHRNTTTDRALQAISVNHHEHRNSTIHVLYTLRIELRTPPLQRRPCHHERERTMAHLQPLRSPEQPPRRSTAPSRGREKSVRVKP